MTHWTGRWLFLLAKDRERHRISKPFSGTSGFLWPYYSGEWLAASTVRRWNLKTHLYFYGHVKPTGVRTNPSRNRSFFENAFKTWEIWKRRLFFVVWTKNVLKRSFSKTMTSQLSCDFPDRVFLNYKSKIISECYVLNCSGLVWTENIWWVFRVRLTFSNSSGVVWTGPEEVCMWM